MENKAYNEYLIQLDRISDLIKKTDTASKKVTTHKDVYLGGRNSSGHPHGHGTLKKSDGTFFKGDWSNGILSGNGTIEFIDGKYEGDIDDFKQNGNGNLTYNNGDVYEGEWSKGVKCGRGTLIYVNGDVYQGEWLDDIIHGKGKMTQNNGNIYDGVWKNGACIKVNQEVKIQSNFGNGMYCGEMKNFMPHGNGKAVYNNGIYDGQWENGTAHGRGEFRHNNGQVDDGIWSNGKLPVNPYSVNMKARDPLMEEASRLLVANQQASKSLLMRKFDIDSNRAVKILDQLEMARIISPKEGNIEQQVLVLDDYHLTQILNHL
jgi:hypothetical protein